MIKAKMLKSAWNLKIEPRSYQSEATNWALGRQQAVCSLPTGTGKTLVAVLWLKRLFEAGKVRSALILEPTRLLVNQTTDYLFYKAGVEAVPIDGRIPRPRRVELWQSELVVATPETAFNDRELVHFDAIVVDECHHTIGQDAFARVIHQLRPSYRLGLSAFIPARREREITELIGPIRRWNWSDPQIAPYVPNWIGEVYEASLSDGELELLKVIRQLPTGDRLNPALLERYLTRDGSVAVRETLTNKNCRLAQAFGEMLLPMVPEGLHKLEAVSEVIDSHEPHKAIIFVDRVVIADKLGVLFPRMQPVVFKGKRGKFDQSTALHQARGEETRLVASTSAGEEGIDLPSADLLVIWGNAASDIRFIQRLGRMMRKTGEGLKFATFVVTPESSDFDSFVRGLERAAEAGTIDVEETFGWDPEVLWPKTTWWHVSELLRSNPRPLSEMSEALEVRDELAEKLVVNAVRRGRIFYIYDVDRIVKDAKAERDRWAAKWAAENAQDVKWIKRFMWNTMTAMLGKMKHYRIYALADDVEGLRHKHPSQFSTRDCVMFIEGKCNRSLERKKGWSLSGYTLLKGLWSGISPAGDLSKASARLANRNDVQSIALSRAKAERLEYFFCPQNEKVLRAVVENAARLFELIDREKQKNGYPTK